jgi:acyl carrier protein
MTHDEIFKKVQEVLVDALGVDEEEVTPNAVLRDDLGAESIDYLDIAFRLEKAFNIKVPIGEMMPENLASDPNYVKDGKVTPAGLAELKAKMPHADFTEFEQDPELEKMSRLFTTEMVTRFVEGKLKTAA